ncbi:hypothetical protein RchiOBHm_Chr7g0207321 [Rosa chinensis]|uniref:Uncharacterized protein n=1 Tax=Rosa chinensis TaxID=74649 RepID=A0A2P6P9E2_ROSCH|nr:hypothetical protein RchiOBHm_Chr7g0207321 [Rosa chinensis]
MSGILEGPRLLFDNSLPPSRFALWQQDIIPRVGLETYKYLLYEDTIHLNFFGYPLLNQ